jgi:hypothetical protein
MKLTKNFTYEELMHSETAVRNGIDNNPPVEIAERQRTVTAPGLEQVRLALNGKPIIVSSGYRCEAVERLVARKDFEAWCERAGRRKDETAWREYFPRKGHPKGYCVDFICPGYGSPREVVRRISEAGVRFDQCIEEGTWVHISFDPAMRQKIMTARFDSKGRPTYSDGLT